MSFGYSLSQNSIIEKARKAEEIKQRINKEIQKKKQQAAINRLKQLELKKREETYKEFTKKLKKYIYNQRRKIVYRKASKIVRSIKKERYRYQDMSNPKYKVINKWRMHQFKDYPLTRSYDGLTAGQAWNLLKNCWIGFRMCSESNDEEGMEFYAKGILKYQYLLEEVEADFTHIGLQSYKYFMESN